MRSEHIQRRVLGAVQFVDATAGLRIADPLQVQAAGATLVRNRTGLFVITQAAGLEEHSETFEQAPSTPALGSVSVALTVSDPSRQYLTRRCTILLPRDPDPANATQSTSLFQPIDVALYPSPAADIASGWAVIRASVTQQDKSTPLSGALIRVLRATNSERLALGLTDGRGEALVSVAGIPVTTWSTEPGAVIVTELDVTIQTVFDKAATGPPDPDDLERRQATLPSSSITAKLAAGRVLKTQLSVTVP